MIMINTQKIEITISSGETFVIKYNYTDDADKLLILQTIKDCLENMYQEKKELKKELRILKQQKSILRRAIYNLVDKFPDKIKYDFFGRYNYDGLGISESKGILENNI